MKKQINLKELDISLIYSFHLLGRSDRIYLVAFYSLVFLLLLTNFWEKTSKSLLGLVPLLMGIKIYFWQLSSSF